MTDRANRYEPLFSKEQLSADLPVVGSDACGTGSVSVHGLPYAQALNQGPPSYYLDGKRVDSLPGFPLRAAATATLGETERETLRVNQKLAFQECSKGPNTLDQYMAAMALEGAKMSRPVMQDMGLVEPLEMLKENGIISSEGLKILDGLKAQQARVHPSMTDASEWKYTLGDAVPVTPLATQVGGSHYKSMKIQPVEYIHANGIGYFEGNVIKYVSRWREKGGVADLEKAKHFIDLLLELERKKI